MGHQHNSHHHHHHTATDGGGLSQRVNSPRFSGPMTRRSHSFKRNNGNSNNNNNGNNNNNNSSQNTQSSSNNGGSHQHEVIDLNLNSPRSESPVCSDGVESLLPAHISSMAQRVHLRRKISSLGVDLGGFGLELKGRRKLGQWMFLTFCGVCLFMGVFKICATGWFGSAIDRLGSNQVDSKWSYQLFLCFFAAGIL